LRTDGTFDDLRLPEGHVHTFVLALNDSGLVGGYAILPNGLAEPFVWDRNQEPIPLPLPPGARGSSLVSLNDRGTAVGGSDFGGDHHRATAWTLRCDR
jgi:hypothetical protein